MFCIEFFHKSPYDMSRSLARVVTSQEDQLFCTSVERGGTESRLKVIDYASSLLNMTLCQHLFRNWISPGQSNT
jgi:hypothetical protein